MCASAKLYECIRCQFLLGSQKAASASRLAGQVGVELGGALKNPQRSARACRGRRFRHKYPGGARHAQRRAVHRVMCGHGRAAGDDFCLAGVGDADAGDLSATETGLRLAKGGRWTRSHVYRCRVRRQVPPCYEVQSGPASSRLCDDPDGRLNVEEPRTPSCRGSGRRCRCSAWGCARVNGDSSSRRFGVQRVTNPCPFWLRRGGAHSIVSGA